MGYQRGGPRASARFSCQARVGDRYGNVDGEGFLGPGLVIAVSRAAVGGSVGGCESGAPWDNCQNLPAAHGRRDKGSNPLLRPSARKGRKYRARPGEVVLVVEDDDDVRDSTAVLLEDLGYSVLAARDGAEALAQLRKGARIDILFTDVVLPQGMNGRALSQEAAAPRPDLPVLFTTGYARNAIIHDGRLDHGVQFIAKPYTQEEIAHKLRAVINSAVKA